MYSKEFGINLFRIKDCSTFTLKGGKSHSPSTLSGPFKHSPRFSRNAGKLGWLRLILCKRVRHLTQRSTAELKEEKK